MSRVKKALNMLVFRVSVLFLFILLIPSLHRIDIAVSTTLFVVWCLTEAMIESPESNNAARKSAIDKGTRHMILGAHFLAILSPLIERTLIRDEIDWQFIFGGAVVGIAGALLRLIAIGTLGAHFTAHVYTTNDQTVCARGPYAFIRHPGYVGLFLINVSFSIITMALYSFVLVSVTSMIANKKRADVEEEALLIRLGDQYAEYCRKTRRWLPRMVLMREARHD